LQLAIDIELFSPVNRNYREGEGRADDCLRHTGIYDLEPDGGGGFLRVETPVVRAFRAAGESQGRIETLDKEREPKEDGRYIIFYHFEDEPEEEQE
jgi:hypothetical protein